MDEQGQKTGIIYCRVSSKEQVDGTSLETQERYCLNYAKQNDIKVLGIYIEKGESAKTTHRTEFQKAITFCGKKKNSVDYFIVYKIDRFSRKNYDHEVTRALLSGYGTQLRSVSEPITETPAGKFMESVMAARAEFDNNDRSERSKDGMLARLREGFWVWKAPMGYYRLTTGSNIIPDPDIAPYIRLAFEEYAKQRISYDSLATFLSERGFRTRGGKKIYPQLLEKILKNPLYCGIMDKWNYKFPRLPEPIISEGLFNQCQSGKIKSRFDHRRVNNPDFPLRRSICIKCQGPLTGSYSRGNGGRYPYYHHHKQGGCSEAKYIPKESLEQLFMEHLTEISPGLKYEKLFKQIVMEIWRSNYKKFDEANGEMRRQIEGLELQRQKVFDLHRTGKYNDDEFFEQKEIINQKLMEKTKLLQDNRVEEFDMDDALTHCFNFVRDSARTWANLKPELKPRFQNQIFEEKLRFDGKKFGTIKMSPVYAINREYGGKKSKLAEYS